MLKESQIEDGRIRIKPSKTQKTSGKAVDIVVTPEIGEVIARARGLKIKYGLISQFVFPTQKGGAYTCLLYTSPSPRDQRGSRMPSSA